jgi:transcriptional regulator with XRE-family HTH domain
MANTDGLLLRLIRIAADKPLEPVAAGAKLSTSHLSKVERGTRVAPPKTIDRIIESILAQSRAEFPNEDDGEAEPKEVWDYDPRYILDLAKQLHGAVAETVQWHRDGTITRAEMVEHVAPLLKLASDLRIALDVAVRRKKSAS